MHHPNSKSGFTLIEMLMYVIILGVIMAIFTGTLTLHTKISVRESATGELSTQLNFTMQTIQRLIRDSSVVILKYDDCNAEINAGIPPSPPGLQSVLIDFDDPIPQGSPYLYRCLKLRTEKASDLTARPLNNPNPSLNPVTPDNDQSTDTDPIYIWAEATDPACTSPTCPGTVKIQEKGQTRAVFTSSRLSCTYSSNITNHCLTFNKIQGYPGHYTVRINLSLTEDTTPSITRSIATNVTRASAATFDAHLVPTVSNFWDLGEPLNGKWNDLFLGGSLSVDGTFKEPGNYNAGDRGFKPIGYISSSVTTTLCTQICSAHGMMCLARVRFSPSFANLFCTDSYAVGENGLCGCE